MAIRELPPLQLPDGRELSWCEFGPADSEVTALYLHGTGASRLEATPFEPAAQRFGVRVVAWDRPRHARSTAQPGRQIDDVVADARAVMAAAGLSRPAVFGTSGGGIHTLALSALAPGEFRRAVTINAGAPADEAILQQMPAQMARNIRLARTRPRLFRALISITQSRNPLMRKLALKGLDPIDRQVLADPVVGPLLEANAAQGRLQEGAWLEEAVMFWKQPWPFRYDHFALPLDVFTGVNDPFKPFAQALAASGATLYEFAGGHISAFVPDQMDAIMAVVAAD